MISESAGHTNVVIDASSLKSRSASNRETHVLVCAISGMQMCVSVASVHEDDATRFMLAGKTIEHII